MKNPESGISAAAAVDSAALLARIAYLVRCREEIASNCSNETLSTLALELRALDNTTLELTDALRSLGVAEDLDLAQRVRDCAIAAATHTRTEQIANTERAHLRSLLLQHGFKLPEE